MTYVLPNKKVKAERFLNFIRPNETDVFEVRVIGPKKPFSDHWEGARGLPIGYYRNRSRAIDDMFRIDSDKNVGPSGIYVTLNRVPVDLLSRANERLKAVASATSDKEILCLQNLLIDLDPARPKGINSTDEELRAAKDCLLQEAEASNRADVFRQWAENSDGNGDSIIKLGRAVRYKIEDIREYIRDRGIDLERTNDGG